MPVNDDEKKSAGIFLRSIDAHDHRKFKALCANEGVNMSDVLINYIKACLKENTLLVKG